MAINQGVFVELVGVLAKLRPEEEVVILGSGGWELAVKPRQGGGFDFTHRNPTGDGRLKFFSYDTTGNPYGAGKIVQEPSLGVSLQDAGIHIDIVGAELAGRIIGAIVLDAESKVVGRFSWSNVVFARKQALSISNDGELVIDGTSQGYVHAIFLPDKNQLDGYVGVFRPTRPTKPVQVIEIETLLFASL